MSSHAIINTLNVARQMTIGKVEGINEELFDIQPPQFNNTIRWNVGHIIAVMDSLVFKRITETSNLQEGFSDLFKGGTKPSDWTSTPASKAELVELLRKQLNDLNETFADRIDEKLPTPFQIRDFKLETIGDVIGFSIVHEGMHTTTISDLVKVINNQNK
ncbi:DinB family protein [Paenibacillus frigoriresistens]|uniref:DinB family protein n=1 Tax=Paenibacillus alginolyticus TaxID=59839 RepID=UPI00156315AF|nr:DinB family protein [Paenibacillus frigoriresistens]NRF94824.1 DinB family protein [Paenibacillus frigoriresistens]